MSNPVAISLTVDDLYDMMDEGQCQHMANKLYKHGYESPRAHKLHQNPDDIIKQLDDKDLQGLIESLLRRHTATLLYAALKKSMTERDLV